MKLLGHDPSISQPNKIPAPKQFTKSRHQHRSNASVAAGSIHTAAAVYVAMVLLRPSVAVGLENHLCKLQVYLWHTYTRSYISPKCLVENHACKLQMQLIAYGGIHTNAASKDWEEAARKIVPKCIDADALRKSFLHKNPSQRTPVRYYVCVVLLESTLGSCIIPGIVHFH